MLRPLLILSFVLLLAVPKGSRADGPNVFLKSHCFECHDKSAKSGGLDLTSFTTDGLDANLESFARWVKIHDRIESGEMPPKQSKRPSTVEKEAFLKSIQQSLIAAERARLDGEGRTGVRRLTRVEYENTIRDLFDLPGIALQSSLPADGSAHGFDKNSDALDISHVNLAKYVEAADHALDLAIA
ncbi:MAG: DUF1587 domain-containing protein, partial [Candidatus Saccharimonas sp.]|nr:DUF1587 domain-containing protein [Planctomycetaceae bacterium]